MTSRTPRRPRPPLSETSLRELALAYVSKFATSRANLCTYLERKLRERGWEGRQPADLAGLAEEFVRRGYVDDAAYAVAKSRSLAARGYGAGRLRQALSAAGIDDEDSSAARSLAETEAVAAALRFARRRRLGPFAATAADRPAQEKAIAAMLRAGHRFDLARRIVGMAPGDEPDEEMFTIS